MIFLVGSGSMIKIKERKKGVTWKDFDDGHEPCRLQLRSVTRDLSLKLLQQEDELDELRKLVESQNAVKILLTQSY